MRRIAKMPLWAESRIHGDVYVRFGGRLSETYHRKVAWRRQPSLQITNQKVSQDLAVLSETTKGKFSLPDDGMPSRVFKCGNYSGWKKECRQGSGIMTTNDKPNE